MSEQDDREAYNEYWRHESDFYAERDHTMTPEDPITALLNKIEVGLAQSAASADNDNYSAVTLTIVEALLVLGYLREAIEQDTDIAEVCRNCGCQEIDREG